MTLCDLRGSVFPNSVPSDRGPDIIGAGRIRHLAPATRNGRALSCRATDLREQCDKRRRIPLWHQTGQRRSRGRLYLRRRLTR